MEIEKSDKTTIALPQYSCGENLAENLDKAQHFVSEAANGGAKLIALQELFQTTYFCREINQKYFEWAEPVPGPTTDHFCKLAKQLQVVILLPLFERKAPGIYFNTMVVIEKDGTIPGIYRKMHIPDDPGFYEKYYFTPGDLGFKVFNTSEGKIGTLICWDQWFPEAARLTAMKGAELLVYPTAIGTLPEENDTEKAVFLDAWQTIQRSHAIANGCFVASVNRVGVEGGTKYWGNSFVAAPFGEILVQAGEEEGVVYTEIDYSLIESQRQIWPFFRDRRVDEFRGLTKRFD
ncbi:MAG: carbon-nitrogen hydrolase [Balneolaceae bacterium]